MHELNLLPVGVVRQQRRRRFTRGMMAAEAVIFLTVALFALCVVFALRNARERTDFLEIRLADAKYMDADRLADALKIAEADRNARLAVSAALPATSVDYAWLDAINHTVPSGITLTEIDLRNERIILTASAANWQEAERHRSALAACGLFTYVRFGAASRTDDGRLRYGLSMGTL